MMSVTRLVRMPRFWKWVGVVLLIYWFILDFILYLHVKRITYDELMGKVEHKGWSLFHPLSTKILMSSPISHYFNYPVCEIFDQVTRFSQWTPHWMPDAIAMVKLVSYISGGLLVSHDNLYWRRWGAFLYFLGMDLDALDGTIGRHQKADQYKGKVMADTSGRDFMMEMFTDTLGAVVLGLSLSWYCFKTADTITADKIPRVFYYIPWVKTQLEKTGYAKLSQDPESPTTGRKPNGLLLGRVFVALQYFLIIVYFAVSEFSWNNLLDSYQHILESATTDEGCQMRQLEIFRSDPWFAIVWFWRAFNPGLWVDVMLLGVFMDQFFQMAMLIGYIILPLNLLLAPLHFLHLSWTRSYVALKL